MSSHTPCLVEALSSDGPGLAGPHSTAGGEEESHCGECREIPRPAHRLLEVYGYREGWFYTTRTFIPVPPLNGNVFKGEMSQEKKQI